MDNDIANKIILLLLEKEVPIQLTWIMNYANAPNKIRDGAIIMNHLKAMGIVEVAADGRYFIPQDIRTEINSLANKFAQKPYEYFLEKQAKEKETETQYKWYLQDDAKRRFEDYPKVVRHKWIAIGISIAAIIVAIAIEILRPKCS